MTHAEPNSLPSSTSGDGVPTPPPFLVPRNMGRRRAGARSFPSIVWTLRPTSAALLAALAGCGGMAKVVDHASQQVHAAASTIRQITRATSDTKSVTGDIGGTVGVAKAPPTPSAPPELPTGGVAQGTSAGSAVPATATSKSDSSGTLPQGDGGDSFASYQLPADLGHPVTLTGSEAVSASLFTVGAEWDGPMAKDGAYRTYFTDVHVRNDGTIEFAGSATFHDKRPHPPRTPIIGAWRGSERVGGLCREVAGVQQIQGHVLESVRVWDGSLANISYEMSESVHGVASDSWCLGRWDGTRFTKIAAYGEPVPWRENQVFIGYTVKDTHPSGLAVVSFDTGRAAAGKQEECLAVILPSGEVIPEDRIREMLGGDYLQHDFGILRYTITDAGIVFHDSDQGESSFVAGPPMILLNDGRHRVLEDVPVLDWQSKYPSAPVSTNGDWWFNKGDERKLGQRIVGANADGKAFDTGWVRFSGPGYNGNPVRTPDGGVALLSSDKGVFGIFKINSDGSLEVMASSNLEEGAPLPTLPGMAYTDTRVVIERLGMWAAFGTATVTENRLGAPRGKPGYFALTESGPRAIATPGMTITLPGHAPCTVDGIAYKHYASPDCRWVVLGVEFKDQSGIKETAWVRFELPPLR